MNDEPPAQPFEHHRKQVERDAHAAATDQPPRPDTSERMLWIAILGGAITAYGGAAWAVGRWLNWW